MLEQVSLPIVFFLILTALFSASIYYLVEEQQRKKILKQVKDSGDEPVEIDKAQGDEFLNECEMNNIPRVKEMLNANGLLIKFKNSLGSTPLHRAAENAGKRGMDTVNFLLDRGADLHKRDYAGNTPLLISTVNNSTEAAIALVKRGASVTVRNHFKNSPIDYWPDYFDDPNVKKRMNDAIDYYKRGGRSAEAEQELADDRSGYEDTLICGLDCVVS